MSKTFSWGILGTGAIAGKFASELPHSQTGRLVAVGSRAQASADKFAAAHGGIRAHGSYESLLADPEVRAVYISTPHPEHAPWAIAAAEAGKHILCEKPLTLNHAEAMVVVEAAKRNGVFLMEAFMYRCHPRTARIAKLIRDGAIGKVKLIKADFSFASPFSPGARLFNNALGGGGILDVGCYTVSIARFVAGAAAGRPFLDPVEAGGCAVLCETGVDAVAVASLKFPHDIVAQLSCGVDVRQAADLEVYGDAGVMRVPQFWNPPGPIEVQTYKDGKVEKIAGGENPYKYAMEADALAAALPNLESPFVSWDDTLGNMQVLDRWREAAGVIYDAERPDSPAHKNLVSRQPLRPNRWAEVPSARIEGLDKPVSRLVMGVDNQRTLAHMSAMADDFLERGGNAFDTAYIYWGGMMESLLGRWIENRGVRGQVVVTVKGAHTPFCTPEYLLSQFEESLARLKTDYADIYLMHRDNPDVPVSEFVDVLDSLHRAGRVRVHGGSNWSIGRLRAANEYAAKTGRQPFRVVSNNLSLAEMISPVWAGCVCSKGAEWRQWFRENGAALFSWSSQARGYFAPGRFAGSVSDAEIERCWDSGDNRERRRRATELAQEKGVSPMNIALAFVLSQPFATFALIGPRTIQETRTALTGAGLQLTSAEVAWLDLETSSR